jgi:adenine deaminase
VPPTGWEGAAAGFGRDEMAAFLRHPMVPALDEVMDWPAVADPANPAHARLWGMIGAT